MAVRCEILLAFEHANAVLGTLEYAIEVLGTPLIMVLGHDSCGAVTATKASVESGELPRGFQRDLVERITPSVLEARRQGHTDLQDMVVEHTKQTAARMLDQSAAISGAVLLWPTTSTVPLEWLRRRVAAKSAAGCPAS